MSSNSNTNCVNVADLDPSIVEAALAMWKQVPFSNRYMFRLVMEDPELCKRTLEVILGLSIKKLVYKEGEKSFEVRLLSKGVRLDVYIEDADGVVYDLEMQASDADGLDIGKRTRYYQSMLDSVQLKKGEHYAKLKRSIIIFICCYDPFKLNFRRYTFSNLCHEHKDLELEDESYKLFINTKGVTGSASNELLNFLDFINTGKGKDGFTDKLEKAVRLNHEDAEKAVTYMTWEQEIITREIVAARKAKAEGRVEGRVEGIAIGTVKGIDVLTQLYAKLTQEGRMDEWNKAMLDPSYRDKLLQEELGVLIN